MLQRKVEGNGVKESGRKSFKKVWETLKPASDDGNNNNTIMAIGEVLPKALGAKSLPSRSAGDVCGVTFYFTFQSPRPGKGSLGQCHMSSAQVLGCHAGRAVSFSRRLVCWVEQEEASREGWGSRGVSCCRTRQVG